MSVENKMVEGRPTCRITGDMRIWEAAEIWQKIHPMLTVTKPFAVDLSTVATCDGSGIQIICQLLHTDHFSGYIRSFRSYDWPVSMRTR